MTSVSKVKRQELHIAPVRKIVSGERKTCLPASQSDYCCTTLFKNRLK